MEVVTWVLNTSLGNDSCSSTYMALMRLRFFRMPKTGQERWARHQSALVISRTTRVLVLSLFPSHPAETHGPSLTFCYSTHEENLSASQHLSGSTSVSIPCSWASLLSRVVALHGSVERLLCTASWIKTLIVLHLILRRTSWDAYCYPYFIGKETETQKHM